MSPPACVIKREQFNIRDFSRQQARKKGVDDTNFISSSLTDRTYVRKISLKGAPMKLSYSSISTYKNCPLSYKFAYVDKLERRKSPALSFGSSIHQALHFFYSNPLQKAPNLSDLIQCLDSNWLREGYSSPEEEASYKELAIRVLNKFHEANSEPFVAPLALEHKFQIDLGLEGKLGQKCFLTGVIDRVQKNPDGSIEVIDYKTNKRLPPFAQVDKDLQLSIYYFAAKETWGVEPEKLTLYFVLPDIAMTTSREKNELERVRGEVLLTASSILKEEFDPKENPLCPWCDFQPICPLFKDKFKDKVEEEFDIESIIDEYVSLKEELGSKKVRLDTLRDQIYNYLAVNQLKRAFSEINAITLSEYPDFQYDVDSIRSILEPLGLFGEVVEIKRNLLQALLESGRLSEDQVRSIEESRIDKGSVKRLLSKRLTEKS